MGEREAIARLQELSLLAARAMAPSDDPRLKDIPPPMHVTLVCARERLPRGERFKLLANMKSPMGEFLSCKEREDGRFDCLGRFKAPDLLAFCMAKLHDLGAHCPVSICADPARPQTGGRG